MWRQVWFEDGYPYEGDTGAHVKYLLLRSFVLCRILTENEPAEIIRNVYERNLNNNSRCIFV